MSTKTKKLTAGVPIVDSTGAVTPVTMEALAKEVGKALGVQTADYNVEGTGWIRVARVDSNASLFMLTNVYINTQSRGILLSVSGSYTVASSDAAIISGNVNLFDKIRFVGGPSGEMYLEIHSSIETGKKNRWYLKSISGFEAGFTSQSFELYPTPVIGSIPEGFTAKEFTLSDLMGGGINTALSSVYALVMKGGQRNEREDKDYSGIAVGYRSRNAARVGRKRSYQANQRRISDENNSERFGLARYFKAGILPNEDHLSELPSGTDTKCVGLGSFCWHELWSSAFGRHEQTGNILHQAPERRVGCMVRSEFRKSRVSSRKEVVAA